MSETSEAIAIRFDLVTASTAMRMHHISVFNSLRLELWQPERWSDEQVLQDTGQCMLSERSFGAETSEGCALFKNDVQKLCSHYTAVMKET